MQRQLNNQKNQLFDYFRLFDFSCLNLAQTGNSIITMCVHNDKLQAIFVSLTLTLIEEEVSSTPQSYIIAKMSVCLSQFFKWRQINQTIKESNSLII